MSTLKDVARLAGVSHGTVSNVLNGSKGVSMEKIRRVEEAIAKLGYKPNALARNLKQSSTGRIDVILPNVTELAHACLYESISRCAREAGYGVYLQITEDSAAYESDALELARAYNTDGVILMTCRPDDVEQLRRLQTGGLKTVFMHRAPAEGHFPFAGLDVRDALSGSILYQLSVGKSRIAMVAGPREYSYEADCVDSYFNALYKAGKDIRTSYVEAVGFSQEAALRAAIRLMQLPEPPEVIYCTGHTLAHGVRCALDMLLDREAQSECIVLDVADWTLRDAKNRVPLPFFQLGEAAFSLLMDCMEGGGAADRRVVVRAEPSVTPSCPPCVELATPPIRVLLQDAPSSDSVRLLLPEFTRRTGIRVETVSLPYKEMLHRIESGTEEFDAFTFDLAWMKELTLGGYVRELTDLYPSEKRLGENFSIDVLREHCYFRDTLYALPYSHTAQMLFYRKDLFDELKNQRLFYEQYKRPLIVPEDWATYNQVARFFTQTFNPESPTRYGTTLGARDSSGAVCEFLPRAWGAGASLFTDGKCAIDAREGIQALSLYVDAFRYAHPDSPDMWWDEQVSQFADGDAAMMVMFTDHTTRLNDRSLSRVVGKVGYACIPGGASVLGGWSIALSPHTVRTREAMQFLSWVCAEDMVIPNAVLGRVEPLRSVYANTALTRFCPYVSYLSEAFSDARRRSMPKSPRGEGVPESLLEEILGAAVHRAVLGKTTSADALHTAAKKLDDAIRTYGSKPSL